MPGVGLPAQMRLSITKVATVRFDAASYADNGQSVFFFLFTDLSNPFSLHGLYRVAATGASNPTSMSLISSQWQNNDFLRFCNPTCYRRFAVYAVTQKQIIMPRDDNDGPMFLGMGFDPIRTTDELWNNSWTISSVGVLPFQLAGTSVQIGENIFNMCTMNPRYSGKTFNNVAGAAPHHEQTIDFDLATVLAIPKSQVYDISHSGYCTNGSPSLYQQPESSIANNAIGYRGVSWICSSPQFYTGSSTDPATPFTSSSGFPTSHCFLQTTYHMILFNDQALDAFSTTNIAPVNAPEEGDSMNDEWSEDDQKQFNNYTAKLSNSLKKIKMSSS